MTTTASYRLPRHVLPERYQLELRPDLEAATFTGTAVVTLRVDEPVNEVILNAAELNIARASLERGEASSMAESIELDPAEQRAILRFSQPIPAGEGYRLSLDFSGVLNDKLHGFYRSTFRNDDGNEHTIATTQFEPADARRAFPCFDEPDFKAVFEITLVVDERLTAISNGSVTDETDVGGGKRRVSFAPTIPMSTYLVAFIVGPFDASQPVDVDGVALRIVTPPNRSHLGAYAEEAAGFALKFLAGYFELPYPSDKIDHVAIPDFAFGAMENLGCVTYRETALLVDPAAASQLERQRVATVVSHETAHMWFGDLVTMKWWNGIWLNEAFATFMELTTTEAFNPDWHVWTAFGAGKGAALAVDGLRTTRPVEFEVGRPEDAEAMFDVLTYQKGGSVLRMLEQYLSPETFRRGIAAYLSNHRYANTETSDLWDAIESVSGEPVRSIMDSWILQGGYPLISASAGDDAGSIRLSQRRFRYLDSGEATPPTGDEKQAGPGETDEPRWSVPINLRASVGGREIHHRILLDEPAAVVKLGEVDGSSNGVDWVVINEGAAGFYRVAYAPELLERLGTNLAQVCSPLEQMTVISDTWAGVVAGAVPLGDWLSLTTSLSLADEDDPDVWSALLGPLSALDLIVAGADRPAVQAFVRRLATPAFNRIGWEPAPDEAPRLGTARARLITALGILGQDPDLQGEAASRYARYRADGSGLSPDVLTAAVNVVVASGGEDGYQAALAAFRQASTPQDQVRYLNALGAAPDPTRLTATLELCLTAEVRSQDAPFLLSTILGSRAGARLTWPWMEAHWQALIDRFPQNTLIRMLEGITGVTDWELAKQVHSFLAEHPLPIGGPRLAQLEERMDITVALARRIGDRIGAEVAGAT